MIFSIHHVLLPLFIMFVVSTENTVVLGDGNTSASVFVLIKTLAVLMYLNLHITDKNVLLALIWDYTAFLEVSFI